jgi:hypothetical protein
MVCGKRRMCVRSPWKAAESGATPLIVGPTSACQLRIRGFDHYYFIHSEQSAVQGLIAAPSVSYIN